MLATRAAALVLATACAAMPLSAAAQWQWLDKDGRKVFSDKAPPPEVPAKSILRQPGVRVAAPAPDAAASAAGAASTAGTKTAAASAPKISGRDSELEQRKKQVELAEAEKKKAQERADSELIADNCRRARDAKAQLDSGLRLVRVNSKGEREVMDDAARDVESQRLAGIVARDCKAAQ